jgi:YesN/AraC family two-component response regulator
MATADPPQPKISLLCVEDDPVSRDLISRMISMKFPDIELHLAKNGMIGLDLFKELMPQIVLTDIRMPVMDGVTMAGEIKALYPETRIIIVAANCNADYLLSDEEIDYCVVKPIDYKILFAVIEKCIADITANLSLSPTPDTLFDYQ